MRRTARRSGRHARALTVAGSDSSGGAGIQADLAVFRALDVIGTSAVTAVTAQTTRRVLAVSPLPPRFVARQVRAVLEDVGADAVKTGMLWSGEVVRAVAREFRRARVGNLVVDPVIRATSGARLLDEPGVEALRTELLPLARVVTPNLAEAEALAGIPIRGLAAAEEAARRIGALGPAAVVVTGGHLAGDPVEVLFDGRRIRHFRGSRIAGDAHGTGCAFSAALAAALARGESLVAAVESARRFVRRALRSSVAVGTGRRILGLTARR